MTTLSDNFTRADSTSLGASWTEVVGNVQLLSNQIRCVTTGEDAWVRRTDDLATANHYSQAVATKNSTPTGTIAQIGVMCRWNGTDFACYLGRFWHSTAAVITAEILRVDAAGASTVIATATSSLVTSDVVRLESVGDQHTLKKNGSIVLGPSTDATVTTGLRTGFLLRTGNGSSADFELDTWEAGDLAAALVQPAYQPQYQRAPILAY